MRLVKLIVQTILLLVMRSVSVHAQNNQNTDLKLYTLEDISHIDAKHLHTFYEIKKYHGSTDDKAKQFNSFENGDTTIFHFFIIQPLYTVSKDTINYTPEDTLMMYQNEDYSYRGFRMSEKDHKIYAWLGYVFEKQFYSKLTPDQMEEEKKNFMHNASVEWWYINKFKKVEYFERIDSGYLYDNYLLALKNTSKKKPMFFIPKYEPFVQK